MKSSRATSKTKTQMPSNSEPATPNPNLHERVAVAAYFKAAERNFAPGNELEDWLSAEAELVS